MNLKIYPRDPLLVRDGRPFSSDPGARARTLPFPLPSVLAGAVRTLAGSDSGGGFKYPAQIAGNQITGPQELLDLLKTELLGPVLYHDKVGLLFPAPADALLLGNQLLALKPEVTLPGEQTNLQTGLWPVFLQGDEQAKPDRMPPYWAWGLGAEFGAFRKWLAVERVISSDLTPIEPEREVRSHVSIQSATQTAAEGLLFQTEGLEFRTKIDRTLLVPQSLKDSSRLSLVIETTASGGVLQAGLSALGGERRLSRFEENAPALPKNCPPEIEDKIATQKKCRLVLLTPALFGQGYLPSCTQAQPSSGTNKVDLHWTKLSHKGVVTTIRAVACGRNQSVSGWDLARGGPKPTRRLAAAGSVYWLELGGNEPDIHNWVREVWMHNVSDDPQDCNDGFGLAALGVWA
jgi:CRISPR-associated protein Cmr3